MKACFLIMLLLCFACTQPATTENKNLELVPTEVVDPVVEETVAIDPASSIQDELETVERGVYVTNEGDKYHTADCRYSKTAHVIQLSQAKADGKTACGICKPNSKTGEIQTRCSANTLEGKRCQRMTTDASGKCFQHREG